MLESIVDEIRRHPNAHVETKTANCVDKQGGRHVSEDLEALGYLLLLTTRELRELFKEHFNLSIPCCLELYTYKYESPMDAYIYKQWLKTLLRPFVRSRPVVIDINNLA